MTALDFAAELEATAESISDIPRADLAVILRRAALRLRNAPVISLEPDVEGALASIAGYEAVGRIELINNIVRDWLVTNEYLKVGSETEGTA